MQAGVLLHAPLAHKCLLAVFALELLGDVVQHAVHLQAVLVGERLAAHLAGVGPHARVRQHVDPQRVQLRQRLPADVAHKLPPDVRRRLVVQLAFRPLRGALLGRRFGDRRSLAPLLLVSGQVSLERGGVLELLAAELQRHRHTVRGCRLI